MDKHGPFAFLTVLFVGALAFAQSTVTQPATTQTAAATATAPAPSIVSNVDEVTLDLIVHNKKNKPVLDLKPTDIGVTDNGSAVKLSDLRLVTDKSGAEHFVTLFFDRLDPSSATNARSIANKFLKAIPADGFNLSVLTMGGRLRLLQGFTTDRAAVQKAIVTATERTEGIAEDPAAAPEKNLLAMAQTGTDSSGSRIAAKDRDAARVMLASLQESQHIVQDQHCMPSLAGLLALARTQRQLSGRKVVLFFEQGPQLDSNAKDMLYTITGAANRSGVSIYVVAANAIDEQAGQGLLAAMAIGGMMSATRMGGSSSATTGSGTALQPVAMAPPGSIVAGADSLTRFETGGLEGYQNSFAALAGKTGGSYITPSDSLKKSLQQFVEDMTTYYEASYAPAIQEYDGKFRPVVVHPVRSGLKVRARAGYFALPPGPGSGMRSFEAPILKLFTESPLPDDVKFHAAVLRLGNLPAGNENVLVVEVPLSELHTLDDPNSNLYSLHASIVGQVKNKAGDVIERFSEDVPRHGSLDSKEKSDSERITMQRHFLADPGEYVVEAAVLDRNNQKVGAQRLPFEISATPAGPSLSEVALVERTEPLSTDADSAEPLRYGSSKVVPRLSADVAKDEKHISFFFLVHPDPASDEQPRLEMEVLKSGEQIAQMPLQLRKTTGPASIPYLASIQSASLSGGDYQVIERLEQGGRTVQQAVNFRIEGASLASAATGPESSRPSTEDADVPSQPLPGIDGHGRHLVITSLSPDAASAPSQDQLDAIIASARKRALEYTATLPNFICIEVTDRSVDQSGNGSWKHRDSLAELLTYHDNQESRTTLQVNGQRSSLKRSDLNSAWPLSVGEFGALLKLVFAPTSKASFEWKEAAMLDGSGTLQVLNYRVAPENATINLGEGNNTVGVGFHGLIYIDSTTGGIRRITVEADGLPRTFPMHAAAMTVEYDYVQIAARDYLLPVRSTVSLQRHKRQVELNEIAFRNYRRFASRTKIKMLQ